MFRGRGIWIFIFGEGARGLVNGERWVNGMEVPVLYPSQYTIAFIPVTVSLWAPMYVHRDFASVNSGPSVHATSPEQKVTWSSVSQYHFFFTSDSTGRESYPSD